LRTKVPYCVEYKREKNEKIFPLCTKCEKYKELMHLKLEDNTNVFQCGVENCDWGTPTTIEEVSVKNTMKKDIEDED